MNRSQIPIIAAIIGGMFAIFAAYLGILSVPQSPITPLFTNMDTEPDVDGNYYIIWGNSKNADYYILQEDLNASFTNPIIVYQGPETKSNINGKSEGDYYYRVKACNNDGESDWSSPRKITVHIIKNTPEPSPPPKEAFMVYSDIGICSGDVWIWSGADWGLPPPLLADGSFLDTNAPEGTTCFAVTSGSNKDNYVGWGIFVGIFEDHTLITPHTVDLSDYSNLEFWVKTPIDLKVEIQQDNPDGTKSLPCLISNYGWDSGLPNEWQKVTIPKSEFSNVDLTKIFCPFMITGKGSEITFYIDNVEWVP